MTAFISISVCSEAVLFFRCNPFYIKWWETSESLGRERWSHWCQTNTFHSIYFCHIRKNVLFWKMSEWIASRRFCSPYVKLSPVKLSKGLVAMEVVPKWPRNTGTWLHEIESHYLNFHQYCVRDSLFIPLVRLSKIISEMFGHIKWELCWHPPRGTQRGLVFILGSLWCSGMITAVSHHPILSCLDTRVTSGLLCSCHSQMHSGDTFNILEHLDSGILPFWIASSFP